MAGDGVTTKKWWESRTLWFNTFGTVLLVAERVQPLIPLDPLTVGTIISVGNLILRRYTTTALTK